MDQHTETKAAVPTSPDDETLDLSKYWRVLVKRRLVILAVLLASVGVTALITARQQRIYSASTSIVIDMQAPQVLGEVRDAVEVGTTSYWFSKEFYETQYRILKSRAIAEKVVAQLGLDNDHDFCGAAQDKPSGQDAATVLQRHLSIEPIKDSRLVNIRVEDKKPDRAAAIANAVASTYIQANLDRRIEGARDAAAWLEGQLAELKNKLQDSELALHTFKKNSDLIYTRLEDKQTIASQKLIAINDTLTKVRTREAELEARVRAIRAVNRVNGLEKALQLGVIASNEFVNALKVRYLEAAAEQAELAERYGQSHPKLRAAEDKTEHARANLFSEVDAILSANENEFQELGRTEANLVAMLDGVKREALDNNMKEIEYKRLSREEEQNQRLFDLVLKRMKELDLSSMLKANNVRVLDAASIPATPSRPDVPKALIMATLLGILTGVGFAFLIEVQDRSIKSLQDVEALGLHVLGIIPSIPVEDSHRNDLRDLYIFSEPQSNVAECCRTIRTNLSFMSAERPLKRLIVTSAAPQEGKTTTIVNLGITLAGSGDRVLLVDTDMRRPRLHKSFGLANDRGVSSVIVGDATISESLMPTNVPNLFVLPSGPIPPNPAELLHTERFHDLTQSLASQFDHVLFDSPPLGAVTDPLVLANVLDGTILVVKTYKTRRDVLERAMKVLNGASATIAGVVMNDVEVHKAHYGYYLGTYYGYDSSYSSADKKPA